MQVYKNIKSISSSIEINQYFASFIKEDEDYYHFLINFSLLQSDIIQNNISKVKISAYNSYVVNSDLGQKSFSTNSILSQKLKYDPVKILLNKHYDQQKLSEEKESSLIETISVENLSSSVFYGAADELKSGKDPKNVSALYKSVKSLVELTSIDKMSILNFNNDVQDIRGDNLELISRFLLDPSEAFYQKQDPQTNSLLSKIRKFYLNRKSTSAEEPTLYKVVLAKQLVDRLTFTSNFRISKKFSVVNDLDFVFEVYQYGSDSPVDTVTKKLNVLKHAKLQNLISNPPEINFVGDKVILKQNDGNANSIKLLKKEINNSGLCTEYSLVDEIQIFSGKSALVSSKKRDNMLTIYRAISQSTPSTKKGNSFKSIVVGSPTHIDQTGLIINDKRGTVDSLEITIVNQPAIASQYKIIRKQVVSGVVREDTAVEVTRYSNFSGLTTVTEDNSVKNGQIYEYSIYYKTSTGEERKSVSQIYRYVTSSIASTVSSVITNPTFDSFKGKPRIQFLVNSKIQEKEADKIKSLLRQSDIYEEFSSEMTKINDTFGNLIAYNVTRVNLKTGIRETFFDIDSNGSFSDDIQTRQKFSISDIDPNTSYLYELRTFLRNPLTLFRDYIKTVTVQMGQGTKTYSYRPYKWRQPTTLSNGTILAQDNEGNIISQKKLLEDGEIGVTATYLATGLQGLTTVSNLFSERLDLHKIKVSWSVDSISQYDHFVVVKETNGNRKILGAFSSLELIDELDHSNDLGTISYYVTPVLIDYSVGITSKTNSIFVDPNDFNFTKNFF